MNLWGDEFVVESTNNKSKKLIDKINNPKKIEKPKSNLKKLSVDERLNLISEEVNKVLGHYKDNTIIIKSNDQFLEYIDECINNSVVALDTETNNSLDPLTCKLMGLCLYTPGKPSAYIPINHVDKNTNTRLDWQVTEDEVKFGLSKLDDSNVKIITHNGKFDYKVIKCTCNYSFNIFWDSMVAARILDENEHSAGLKQQYILKIDSTEEKYSIDHLFENVEYAIVDPEIFALYAATDAYKTYRLYEWQINELNKLENKRLLNLLFDVEFPIITITSEMELDGISLDLEYCERLSKKYHNKLDAINEKLNEELENLKPKIEAWRNTSYAKEKGFRVVKGNKVQNPKTRSEQLEDPPALTSPTQLAILLYDVLKIPVIDRKNPRGTGEDILKQIDLPIVKLIIEQRTLLKLLDAFIDALPKLASEKDGKIHSNFNQLGTDTGRFSCTQPNLQQIPARNVEIRMMFCADDYEETEELLDSNDFICYSEDELLLDTGWKKAHEIKEGNLLVSVNSFLKVKKIINISDNNLKFIFCE